MVKNRHRFINDSWCGKEPLWLLAERWAERQISDSSASEWCGSRGGGKEPMMERSLICSGDAWRAARSGGGGERVHERRLKVHECAEESRLMCECERGEDPRDKGRTENKGVHLLSSIFKKLSQTHRWVSIFFFQIKGSLNHENVFDMNQSQQTTAWPENKNCFFNFRTSARCF